MTSIATLQPVTAANNPFRSERVTTLPFLPQGKDWATLLQDLEAMQWRGAVVGPCGTGKTTLLDKLQPELQARGFNVHLHRLASCDRALPKEVWKHPFATQDAIILDGAEQMSLFQWRRFRARTSKAGALIITTHREGRFPTWLTTSTSPALLRRLCNSLGFCPSEKDIERVFRAHEGNLRLCLMEFYDLVAKSP